MLEGLKSGFLRFLLRFPTNVASLEPSETLHCAPFLKNPSLVDIQALIYWYIGIYIDIQALICWSPDHLESECGESCRRKEDKEETEDGKEARFRLGRRGRGGGQEERAPCHPGSAGQRLGAA